VDRERRYGPGWLRNDDDDDDDDKLRKRIKNIRRPRGRPTSNVLSH